MSARDPMDEALADALVREGRDYKATPGTRARTLAALGLEPAVVPAPSFLRANALKLALGAGTALVAGALALARPAPPGQAPAPTSVETAIVVAAPAPLPPVEQDPPTPTVAAPPRAQALITAPTRLTVRPQRATSAPTPPSSTLALEIAAIDRVRQAVYAKDKEAALRGLDDYDRQFPGGTLAPEAKSLRDRATALR